MGILWDHWGPMGTNGYPLGHFGTIGDQGGSFGTIGTNGDPFGDQWFTPYQPPTNSERILWELVAHPLQTASKMGKTNQIRTPSKKRATNHRPDP